MQRRGRGRDRGRGEEKGGDKEEGMEVERKGRGREGGCEWKERASPGHLIGSAQRVQLGLPREQPPPQRCVWRYTKGSQVRNDALEPREERID